MRDDARALCTSRSILRTSSRVHRQPWAATTTPAPLAIAPSKSLPLSRLGFRLYGDQLQPYSSPHAKALCAGRLSNLPGGWVVLDDVLSREDAVALHAELHGVRVNRGSKGSSVHGSGGDGSIFKPAIGITRDDHIFHINEHEAGAAELPMLAKAIGLLKSIGYEAASAHALGAADDLTIAPRAQVACYPGTGAGYKRHSDNRAETMPWSKQLKGYVNWRVFTCIMYVNPHWKPDDGGCLQIHPHSSGRPAPPVAWGSRGGATAAFDTTPCDIEPYAGRVLLFDSLLQHEVMPSFRDRYAITLWTWREDGDQDKVGFS